MFGKKSLKTILFTLILAVFATLSAETLAVMEITDSSGKIHPDVVKGSKEYIIKMLGSLGKYTIIQDSAVESIRKRSPDLWKLLTAFRYMGH